MQIVEWVSYFGFVWKCFTNPQRWTSMYINRGDCFLTACFIKCKCYSPVKHRKMESSTPIFIYLFLVLLLRFFIGCGISQNELKHFRMIANTFNRLHLITSTQFCLPLLSTFFPPPSNLGMRPINKWMNVIVCHQISVSVIALIVSMEFFLE